MTEPWRTRTVESPVTQETAPQASSTPEIVSDTLRGNETKASDPISAEERKLEIWEGLNRKKYVAEFFKVSNIQDEFNIKMQTSQIDKYIGSELEKLGYEKNIDNWEKVLGELEDEIGSKNMEVFKRLQKITGYINAISKLYKAKQLKDKYLISNMSS